MQLLRAEAVNRSKQTGTRLKVPVCLLCLCCLLWQTLLPAFSQTYDLRGRMTLKQPDARLNEATLTWSYPNENTRIATRGSLQTTYTSNPQRGWLQSVQSPTGTLSYGYDDGGQKTSVSAPSGLTSYSYDVLGRVQNVYDQPAGTSNPTAIAAYDYDNVGNLKSVSRGNGIVTSYGYDELNRLSDMVNAKGASEVSRFHYPVRADGKRTGLTERLVNADLVNNAPRVSNRSVSYGYDDAGRLTGEAGDDGLGVAYQTGYTYNKVGNRTDTLYKRATTAAPNTFSHTTTVASTFNDNDWLTSQTSQSDGGAVQTQSYTYDRSGSQLTEQNGSNTPQENDWGFDGKLQGTKTQGQSTGGTSYTTDAAGNRVGVTLQTGKPEQKTTRYLVEENTSYASVVEERAPDTNDSAASELQARYVWGQGLAPLAMWRKGNDGTVKLFFMLSDGQESVRQLVNAAGAVTDSYYYDVWGNALAGGSGTTVNHFRYTGQMLDPSGHYFLRARYYDPGTGRFLSHDPVMGSESDPVSLHRYVYGNNDPASFCDPSGKIGLSDSLTASQVAGILSTTATVGYLTGMGVSQYSLSKYAAAAATHNYPEISAQLKDVLNRIDKAFAKLTEAERDELSHSLYDMASYDSEDGLTFPANGSWDIVQLTNTFNEGKSGGDSWVDSASTPSLNGDPQNRFVRVNGQTFHTYTVNYILFGRLTRLLAETTQTKSTVGYKYSDVYVQTAFAKVIPPKFGADMTATIDWMNAGWNEWHKGKWATPSSSIKSLGPSGEPVQRFIIGNYLTPNLIMETNR